tara:strand:- start:5620 stop:6036 length:417 start_codon:yes stop_codon:yes gene_type:complete
MRLEVRINLILHATENQEKVLDCFEQIFNIEQKDFHIKQIPGHFNNPILLVSCSLKKISAESFIKKLFSKMEKNEYEQIYNNIDEFVSSSGLSLRINKQKIFLDIISLSKEDAVKITINTPVYVKNQIKKTYQELITI